MTDHSIIAKQLFLEGCNCSQSLLLAFSDVTGFDRSTSLKLSGTFGGGMGRLREVCGAVSGAFAVLGFLCGYDDPTDKEGKSRHYSDIRELARRITEKSGCGSIICREILASRSIPNEAGGEAEARTPAYYHKRPCADLVYIAAEALGEMLDEKGKIENEW